jgi:preprotein translocase subunit SecF
VLPIISLMVVAVWLLGVGTLKDLALVQLVGVVVGAYSSIFLATPLLVSMRERTELVRTHTRRVLNRRKPGRERTRVPDETTDDEPDADKEAVGAASVAASTPKHAVADKPAPGARPIRPTSSRTGRPAGKRNTRRR